jgi:hypothetical protein
MIWETETQTDAFQLMITYAKRLEKLTGCRTAPHNASALELAAQNALAGVKILESEHQSDIGP